MINFLQALSKIFAWSILEIFPQVCLINDDSNANWHLSTSFLLDLDIVYSYNKYLPRRKFVPFQESSKFTLGKRSLFTLYTNSFYSIFAYKKKNSEIEKRSLDKREDNRGRVKKKIKK